MKTNFNFELESLVRMTGNQSAEADVARKAAEEITNFVTVQANLIKSHKELGIIMTNSGEVALLDSLTAINHISHAMKAVRYIHESSKLKQYFNPVYKLVAKHLDESTTIVKELRAVIVR
jgi:hypothetical protein